MMLRKLVALFLILCVSNALANPIQQLLLSYGKSNPNVHTLLLLHMDGSNGGTSFPDSSFNGFTVTPTLTTTSSTQIEFGTASGLFAATSYLTLPSSSTLDLTGDFTIEFWLYPSATISQYYIVPTTGLGIYTDTGGYIHIDGPGGNIYTSPSYLTANTWQCLAFVRSGSTFYIFKNGVSASLTYSGTITEFNISTGTIGRPTSSLTGYMDEVRVSNSALYTSNYTCASSAFTN